MTEGWLPKRNKEQQNEYNKANPNEKAILNKKQGREQRAECQEKNCDNEATNFPSRGLLGWCTSHNLMIMKKIDPDFEKGSIAFYENEFGLFPCRIVGKKTKRPDEVRIYEVTTDNGLLVEIPAFELMTGWEGDFPDLSEIDWGWKNWTEKHDLPELPDEDYPDSRWNPHEEWEPDDAYYSDLAEEWEQEQAVCS